MISLHVIIRVLAVQKKTSYNEEFKVNLSYLVSLRPAWETKDCLKTRKKKKKIVYSVTPDSVSKN